MAYPNYVTLEFCHRHRTWRAFGDKMKILKGQRKIIAFDHDESHLKEIAPNFIRISPKDTGDPYDCLCSACE